MPCLISVIIPTYNRASLLPRAIDSVLKQTFNQFELLIVDDGSTDDTEALIANYTDQRIKYIHQPHAGVSAARNTGALQAQTEWLAFLDSDDEWLPNKLIEQWQFHQQHPEFEISQTEDIWIRNGLRVQPPKTHRKQAGYIFTESLKRCMISPSAVILSKTLFWNYGGFRLDLPACEDYALWLKITLEHPIGLVPTPLVVRYAGHKDQLSSQHPVMDRFRIMALEDILPEIFDPVLRQISLTLLSQKCSIVAEGSLKRGRLWQWWAYYRKQKRYESVASNPI